MGDHRPPNNNRDRQNRQADGLSVQNASLPSVMDLNNGNPATKYIWSNKTTFARHLGIGADQLEGRMQDPRIQGPWREFYNSHVIPARVLENNSLRHVELRRVQEALNKGRYGTEERFASRYQHKEG